LLLLNQNTSYQKILNKKLIFYLTINNIFDIYFKIKSSSIISLPLQLLKKLIQTSIFQNQQKTTLNQRTRVFYFSSYVTMQKTIDIPCWSN
jgi:hypothetical protein